MKVLAADTSTKIISVALIEDNKNKACVHKAYSKSRGSSLIWVIKDMLEGINYDIKDIGLFAVGLGPGSFTGLRASVTAMRSLAITLSKPIIGISSFDTIAHNLACSVEPIARRNSICVMFDARQNKVYARFYRQKPDFIEPLTDFLLDSLDNILTMIKEPTLIAGDAIDVYGSEILKQKKDYVSFAPKKLWYPKAGILAKLALEKHQKGYADDPYKVLPLYIYSKECQVKQLKS